MNNRESKTEYRNMPKVMVKEVGWVLGAAYVGSVLWLVYIGALMAVHIAPRGVTGLLSLTTEVRPAGLDIWAAIVAGGTVSLLLAGVTYYRMLRAKARFMQERGHAHPFRGSWDLSRIRDWTKEETEVACFAGLLAVAVISGAALFVFLEGRYLAAPLVVGFPAALFLVRAMWEWDKSTSRPRANDVEEEIR